MFDWILKTSFRGIQVIEKASIYRKSLKDTSEEILLISNQIFYEQ